ncbi:MAG TPA: LytR C-terminal domain-containing protein [Candidatus Dojkabacteria bacterium]|nr:LytR C-terminal domain-containing protein [Candidatus Dojkabacteria bacterium]
MPRRRVKKKQYKSEKPKRRIPFLKILLAVGLATFLLYTIYFLINVFSVKTVDVTISNNSTDYLLARKIGDLEKTLIIFEEGEGDSKKVTDVYVYLVNPAKKQELLLYIPGEIYFAGLEDRFGNEIAVSTFRYAGDFLQKGRGVEYAVWQFNQLFGFKSNNYIFISAEANAVLESSEGSNVERMEGFNEASSYAKSFFDTKSLSLLNEKIYSNLSFQNVRLKIHQASVGNSKYKRTVINYSDEKFLRDGKLITGEGIKVLNTLESDKEYTKELQFVLDRALELERVRVEVYNGSGITGAAGSMGRKIANTGCDVVRYGNAPEDIERTRVYVSDVERFKNSFMVVDDSLEIDFELINGRPEFMTTGDIVVVLGMDIEKMYSF